MESKKHNDDIIFHVEKFSGENPELLDCFFDYIISHSTINKWNNNTTLLFLKENLSDAALKCFQDSELYNCNNLDLIRKAFNEKFKSRLSNSKDILFQNVSIVVNKAIANFAISIREAASNIFKDFEADLVKIHDIANKTNQLQGQQDTIMPLQNSNNSVKLNQCNDELLFNRVKMLEDHFNNYKQTCMFCAGNHTVSNCIEFVRSTLTAQKVNEDHSSNNYQGYNSINKKCFHCGKVGHLIRHCYLYKQKNQRSGYFPQNNIKYQNKFN